MSAPYELICTDGHPFLFNQVQLSCLTSNVSFTKLAAMLCSRIGSSSLAVAGARRQRHAVASRHSAVVRVKVPLAIYSSFRSRRTAPTVAAAPTDEQPSEPAAADAEAASSAAEQPFPTPSTHHMPEITSKERAVLRAQSESLAKAKTLQRLIVGAQGITFNVLVSPCQSPWHTRNHLPAV